MKSTPSGDFIDQIHENWFANYDLLEDHHGYTIVASFTYINRYIQWLFPVFESGGMNSKSSSLTKVTVNTIKR
jgi:hypothetical protein